MGIQWGAAARVFKSVQAFSISINTTSAASGTATITAVNTAKAFILFNGQYGNPGAATESSLGATQFSSAVLTNSTTVTVNIGASVAAGANPLITRGYVVEVY
jgi:hypothetical protein